MDSDVYILEKGWLRKAIKIMKKYPNIGVLGCSVAKYIDRKPEELGFLDKDKKIKICDYAPTIMVTKKSVIEDGCYIDEFFSMHRYDSDWQTTIRSKGYLIAHRRIKHLHVGGVSCDYVFRNKKILNAWLNNEARGALYFIEKHKNILNEDYYDSVIEELDKKRKPNKYIFLAKWHFITFRGKAIRFVKRLLGRY
jgi:GT2 family glycosyltransferase